MVKSLNIRPLYATIADEMMRRIRSTHRPGDLLPTQQELAAEFDTSLITVKRALTELGRLGVIDSVRGRGTIVRNPIIADDHAGISSWTDSIGGLGVEPHTAWTKLSVRVPPVEIGRVMGLRARERTVCVERLRTVEGTPICLMTNEIPQRLVPDLAQRGLDKESLYACLAEGYGLSPSVAEEEVSARSATRDEEAALRMNTGIVLEVRRLTRQADGEVMELATIVAPVDRYRYRVTLHAKSPGGKTKDKRRKTKD
jgi:GntR family transcriptional regulator